MLEKIKIVAAGAIFMCLVAAFVFEEWRISRQHQVVPLGTVSETAIQTSASSYLQKYSAYCAAKPTQDNERWTHDFWCEYKVTDFVIAAFTVALVVVTGGLM